jgi:vacuolar iron transporter family protein
MASALELKRCRRHLADELDSAAVYDTLSREELCIDPKEIAIGLVAAAFTAGAGHLLGVSIS